MRTLRALGVLVLLGTGAVFLADAAPFGDSRVPLAATAFVLAAAAVFRATDVRFVTPERPSPADVERGYRVPTPGDTFADADESVFRERIRAAAVEAVADTAGCSREVAAEQVEAGVWTDDDLAAAYVAGEEELPLGKRLRLRARGEGPRTHVRTRALDAVERCRERGVRRTNAGGDG